MLTHSNKYILMLHLKKKHPKDFNIYFYEYKLLRIKKRIRN